MAVHGFYSYGLDQYVQGNIRPLTDTIRIYVVTSGYSPNLGTNQFLATISSGDRIGFATLSNKTVSSSVFDNTSDVTVSNPLNASGIGAVLVKWTGSDATSILIAYTDDFTASTSDPINVAFDAAGVWGATG